MGISDELSADSTSDMWSPLLPAKCHESWSLPLFISPTPLSPVSNTPGLPVILSPSLITYVRTGFGTGIGAGVGWDGVLVAGTDGVAGCDGVVVAGTDGVAGCDGVAGWDGVVVDGDDGIAGCDGVAGCEGAFTTRFDVTLSSYPPVLAWLNDHALIPYVPSPLSSVMFFTVLTIPLDVTHPYPALPASTVDDGSNTSASRALPLTDVISTDMISPDLPA